MEVAAPHQKLLQGLVDAPEIDGSYRRHTGSGRKVLLMLQSWTEVAAASLKVNGRCHKIQCIDWNLRHLPCIDRTFCQFLVLLQYSYPIPVHLKCGGGTYGVAVSPM